MQVVEELRLQNRGRMWSPVRAAPDQDRTGRGLSAVGVMVVDDDDRVRWLTARMLREEGYQVIEARSVQHAWERLAQSDDVQVVLTDIAMPGGSGLELAERIAAERSALRIILMSGYDRVFPKLGSAGARFPLLVKPFTPDQLVHQIRAVLPTQEH
jgi:two-component system cell cycle sensor histidine kinase/response regulator CckA